MSVLGVLIPQASKRQNEPDSTIGDAISFTLLAVMGRILQKQGVAKTRTGQASRPKRGKSLIIPTRQEMIFQNGGTSTAFQDVRGSSPSFLGTAERGDFFRSVLGTKCLVLPVLPV